MSVRRRQRGPIRISDLASERRWPRFCASAVEQTPVRASLSLPLEEQPQRAALNLYSRTPHAFGPDTLASAVLFAAHARVLLLHAQHATEAANLAQALHTSRRIGAAIGILMSAHKITEEQAFHLLRTSSQKLNRKLAAVAEEVTTTGTLPD